MEYACIFVMRTVANEADSTKKTARQRRTKMRNPKERKTTMTTKMRMKPKATTMKTRTRMTMKSTVMKKEMAKMWTWPTETRVSF